MNKGINNMCNNHQMLLSRRDALKGLSAGFGYMAFAGLTSQAAVNAPLAPRRCGLYVYGAGSACDLARAQAADAHAHAWKTCWQQATCFSGGCGREFRC